MSNCQVPDTIRSSHCEPQQPLCEKRNLCNRQGAHVTHQLPVLNPTRSLSDFSANTSRTNANSFAS